MSVQSGEREALLSKRALTGRLTTINDDGMVGDGWMPCHPCALGQVSRVCAKPPPPHIRKHISTFPSHLHTHTRATPHAASQKAHKTQSEKKFRLDPDGSSRAQPCRMHIQRRWLVPFEGGLDQGSDEAAAAAHHSRGYSSVCLYPPAVARSKLGRMWMLTLAPGHWAEGDRSAQAGWW